MYHNVKYYDGRSSIQSFVASDYAFEGDLFIMAPAYAVNGKENLDQMVIKREAVICIETYKEEGDK